MSLVRMVMKVVPTPGGKRLRALREYHNKTQLDVELDASLGIGYLQRLELGRVKQPERDTLDRILSALNARYTERRDVLELFGYMVDAPLPTQADIDWAISVCHEEIDSAVFPVYLLDCASRLLYWNHLVPNLFRVSPDDLASEQDAYSLMLKIVFDPSYGMTERIQNGDDFFRAQIRAFRHELQRFHDEQWQQTLIEDMLRYPLFEQYWHHTPHKIIHIPARPLTSLEVAVADKALKFYLIAETFIQDHRFRVIYCLPADTQTNSACMGWLQDGGV